MAPPKLIELKEDDQLAELVKDWRFEDGVKFQARVIQVTNRPVHHASFPKVGSFHCLRFSEDSHSGSLKNLSVLHCMLAWVGLQLFFLYRLLRNAILDLKFLAN